MDFYKALGVSRAASKQEVRDAWRKQALENHPDRLQGASDFEKQEALRKFNRAKEAYEVLGDESKRALYDSSGRSAVYAAERTGRSQSSPFRSAYAAPRTRTGWSNFWYQQQQYNTHGAVFGTMNPFRAFMRGMGRTDMYFHAAFGLILVGGFVFVAPLVDNVWHHLNRGKLFKDIRTDGSVSAGQVARPVLSGDREERLRAQGVPAAIVASMRTFEEQQLRQKTAPAVPSASLSAQQLPEPDEALDDSSMRTSEEQQLLQKLSQKSPNASLSAKQALDSDQAPGDSPSGAEQSSGGIKDAASASGRAEALQISTAPLGQDYDRAVSTSSFGLSTEEVKEEAESKLQDVPKVCKNIKPPSFGKKEPSGILGFFNTATCYLRQKAWVAALGMFYLYNKAVAKLPWIKFERFEKWFWQTFKQSWVDSSAAASVLARKYMSSVKTPWGKTAEEFMEKREEMEKDAEEKMEETKEDIDEAVHNPGKSLQSALSDGAKRLQEGPFKGPSAALDNMSAAASDMKQKVPMLRSADHSEEEGYEQEEQSSQQREDALAASASVSSMDGDQNAEGSSKAKAADDERAHQGKAKKQKSDKDAMKHLTLAESFLGLFRKENETEKPSQLEAGRRVWSLPMPFWKRS
ncbi:g6842 [Coccomyxa viridis]|uniref:G6842 protein n=1 Tax=Coccomyxa viridis TaxID=1274662 RepID=A0ABP1FWB5_9CHLO